MKDSEQIRVRLSSNAAAIRNEERHAEASELFGNYVLKTERTLTGAETWSLYMILLQAEEGFACLNGSTRTCTSIGKLPSFP